MGCGSCSSGGCGTPAGCNNNGSCGSGGCGKLSVFDWLAGMQPATGQASFDLVEIRFKNTRKEFYKNHEHLELHAGDRVAVEAASGYDIGIVSMTGALVKLQMDKKQVSYDSKEIKKIYRHATEEDIEMWTDAREQEAKTMLKARHIANELKLEMKIGDVEYQADKTKATFFYTADDRVDFRELIRVLADQFKVRIEMRQIGARQEAGRLGGIGSCGRELCCSTWLTDFRSVSTSAARYQQLSINPIKLAGQCGKLKCCLNYELETYVDALKDFPDNVSKLKTEKGRAFHFKTDIFKRTMWFTYEDAPDKLIPLSVDRVNEIIALNNDGKKVADLRDFVEEVVVVEEPDFENVVGQDSLTRFDNRGSNSGKKKRRKNRNRNNQNKPQGQKTQGENSNNPKPKQKQAQNKSNPRPPGQGKSQGQNRNKNKRRPQSESGNQKK